MRTLQELVHIVNKHKIHAIQIIGNSDKTNSKVEEFYHKLSNLELQSDEEASAFFYDSAPNNPVYRNLKTRLRHRLLNTLFLLDLNKTNYSDWQKAYYTCYRQWAVIKILLGKNARDTAIGLCHQLMKTARKFEFTDLSLGLTRILRMHYGTRLGDVKKFRKYNDFYKTYTDLWLAENLAEEYYATLVTEYVLSKAKKEDVEKAAMLYLNDLESAAAEYNSYRLQLSVRLIEMIRANVLQDYQQVIAICQQSIDFFDKKPYDAPVPLQIFLHQELVCNIQLRQFERGQQVAQKALDSVEEGSFNWFKHQELYLLLCLHTDAFQQAYEVYQTVFQHKRFRFLADNLRELWYIYEAFIQYLKTIGHIEAEDSSPFRLGRFMNQTPIFSQDKRGMNIPILVVQILFMIIQNKYDKAIDRIEAVEKYCSRYLRKDETFRSNCFIKMLLTIPKSSFHKAAVERHATPLFKKLQQVPPDATGQSYEIEIIPYEKLWTFVLNSLDDKFHKPYSANF